MFEDTMTARLAFGFHNPTTRTPPLGSDPRLSEKAENGTVFAYAYDAAGRLVKEGDRTYRYGYLDKVLSVAEGGKSFAYSYHADGQLARADYGDGRSEDFLWDGLALVRRGDEQFVNEPHPGGGSPILSSKGAAYLNDLLGTTVGTWGGCAAQKRKEKIVLYQCSCKE